MSRNSVYSKHYKSIVLLKQNFMRKILLFSALAAIVGFGQYSHSNSGGAPAGSTGFDGEATCLRCHGGQLANAASPGTYEIFTSNADTVYVPGQTYTFTVRLTGGNMSKYGFQLKTVSGTNAQSGTLTPGTSQITRLSGGRTYLTHSSTSSTGSWNFTWTAPVAGSGTVFFRGIIFNGGGNGDPNARYYRNEFAFREQNLSSTAKAIKLDGLNLYPNPTTEGVNADFSMDAAGPVSAGLFALTGQELAHQDFGMKSAGNHNLRFEFNKPISKGIYVLQLRSGSSYTSKTLRVQ